MSRGEWHIGPLCVRWDMYVCVYMYGMCVGTGITLCFAITGYPERKERMGGGREKEGRGVRVGRAALPWVRRTKTPTESDLRSVSMYVTAFGIRYTVTLCLIQARCDNATCDKWVNFEIFQTGDKRQEISQNLSRTFPGHISPQIYRKTF